MSKILMKVLRTLRPAYNDYLYMSLWGPLWLPLWLPPRDARNVEDPR